MGPGRHQIDADEIPGLGILIDAATGGNAYRAELYFVGTREYTGSRSAAASTTCRIRQTGLIVTLRVFGDYALRVVDPIALITNLLGTVDVTDNDRVSGWVSDQLLKVMRTDITTQIVRNGWPILGLSAYTPEIEQAVIAAGQRAAGRVRRRDHPDGQLRHQPRARGRRAAEDAWPRTPATPGWPAASTSTRPARWRWAPARAWPRAAARSSGAFLAAGLGMGSQAAGQPAIPSAPPQSGFAGGAPGGYSGPPPSGYQGTPPGGYPAQGALPQGPAQDAPPSGAVCAACQTSNPPHAKFCMSCGQAMAAPAVHCTACGTELPPGARFCGNCGTAAG